MFIIKDIVGNYHEFQDATTKDKFINELSDVDLLGCTLFDVVREKKFQVQKKIVAVVSEKPQLQVIE